MNNQLTRQDVFNIAYTFYNNGGGLGYDKSAKGCRYFHGEARCAVGTVLDHLGFTEQDLVGSNNGGKFLNGMMAHGIITHFGSRLKDRLAPEVLADCSDFLVGLQKIHDDTAQEGGTPANLVNYLRQFAEWWNLTIPSTKEVTVDLRELCLV